VASRGVVLGLKDPQYPPRRLFVACRWRRRSLAVRSAKAWSQVVDGRLFGPSPHTARARPVLGPRARRGALDGPAPDKRTCGFRRRARAL